MKPQNYMKCSELTIKFEWVDFIMSCPKDRQGDLSLSLLLMLEGKEIAYENDPFLIVIHSMILPSLTRRMNGKRGAKKQSETKQKVSRSEAEGKQKVSRGEAEGKQRLSDNQQLTMSFENSCEKNVNKEEKKNEEKETDKEKIVLKEIKKEKEEINKEENLKATIILPNNSSEKKSGSTKSNTKIYSTDWQYLKPAEAKEWLVEQMQRYSTKYDQQMLYDFFDYWYAPIDPNNDTDSPRNFQYQINKSTGKYYPREKFVVGQRLAYWCSRNKL